MRVKKNHNSRSPLKDLPVRMPGQSLRDQFDKEIGENILRYLLGIFAFGLLAALEWLRYVFKSPPNPWIYTILFVIVACISFVKLKKLYPVAKHLNQGRRGEEAVGQFLDEKLRPLGCHILHDIPGDDFNVDHVVIGPTGIFTIETKTISKPLRGECKIQYDGKQIAINRGIQTSEPLVQAKAQASWLSDKIEKSTGKRFFVRPVVVYPGWYVETKVRDPNVWVFNEKSLISFIQNANQNTLTQEDVSMITFHLKRFVLSTQT